MRRTVATSLALLLMVGLAGGCAEYTTTGEPADDPSVGGVGGSLAPVTDRLAGTAWKLETSSADSVDLEKFDITADFAEGQVSRHIVEISGRWLKIISVD